MGKWMDSYLGKLKTLNEESYAGGGKERVEVQHSLDKLTARERIERLADPGSFEELGSLVRNPYGQLMETPKPDPGDGVVMGLAG